MPVLTFVQNAGQKLLVPGQDDQSADAITNYISQQGLDTSGLTVVFDSSTATVTAAGTVPDTATAEKVILCCGNVNGVQAVGDNLNTDNPTEPSEYYTVVSGDTVSKIAKQYYGDPSQYPTIVDGNQPMIVAADKIYPGQMLRIPAPA